MAAANDWSARHARPLAVAAAVAATFIAGSITLILTAIVLRSASSSTRLSGTSKFVLVLLAGAAAVGALIPTLKAIDARRRDQAQLANLAVRLATIVMITAAAIGILALAITAIGAFSP